ncbi:MAG: TIGR04100 family radical SAM protein [Clostridiales bacterium]|nr:TIGR04100 family radical SAM protein [Clostridiales bacterium]MCD8154614.1 TIGR04100 family radical SAM protein [Clostridiales bacterium]
MNTILYKVHNNLYVNLTNRCPCACTFCLRQTMDHMGESGSLWLEHTPSLEEVLAAFKDFDLNSFEEVVFCGFGEPTEALVNLLATARFVKEKYQKPTRINTNGLGNLINRTRIEPLLEGLIDTVSISLNTPNEEEYLRLVRPKYGKQSYTAMLDFARVCTQYVPHVVMTTVATTLTPQEEEECARICREIGAGYRIRPWEE